MQWLRAQEEWPWNATVVINIYIGVYTALGICLNKQAQVFVKIQIPKYITIYLLFWKNIFFLKLSLSYLPRSYMYLVTMVA